MNIETLNDHMVRWEAEIDAVRGKWEYIPREIRKARDVELSTVGDKCQAERKALLSREGKEKECYRSTSLRTP